MDPRRELGARGEDLVAAWYADRGGQVVDRNWRSRHGELDLVVRLPGALVFCEVKTRRGDRFGPPAAAVDDRKQARIRRLAIEWLRAHDGRSGSGRALRFDVAAVVLGPDGPAITVVESAF